MVTSRDYEVMDTTKFFKLNTYNLLIFRIYRKLAKTDYLVSFLAKIFTTGSPKAQTIINPTLP